MRELREVAETLGEDTHRPVSLQGTRWLPHLRRALKALLAGYGPLLAHFEHTAQAATASAEMVGRARMVVRHLKSLKSLKTMHLTLDILDALSMLSCRFQEDGVTVSECKQALELTYLTLTASGSPRGAAGGLPAAVKRWEFPWGAADRG